MVVISRQSFFLDFLNAPKVGRETIPESWGKQSLKAGKNHSFNLGGQKTHITLRVVCFSHVPSLKGIPYHWKNWWAKGDYTHFRFGIEGPFSGALAVSFREGNSYHSAHHPSNKHKDGNDSNFSNLCGNSGSDLGKWLWAVKEKGAKLVLWIILKG